MYPRFVFFFVIVVLSSAAGCDDNRSSTDDAGGLDDAGPLAQVPTSDAGEPTVDEDAGPSASPTPIAAGTLLGTVTRTAGLTLPEDGRGTLYIDVGQHCPYTEGFSSATTVTVDDVDMNDPSVEISFEVNDLPPGSYAVWGWLDDNSDTIEATPFPSGDPGNYPDCPTVEIGSDEGARVELVFNQVI